MDTSSPTRDHLRIFTAVFLGVLWVFAAFVVGGFLGHPSEPLGWLWATTGYAVGLVGCAAIWPGPMRVPAGLALGLALVLGLADWYTSPPTHERLAAKADDVEVPAGWELEGESALGNTWCFKGCPELTRTYVVPGEYAAARDAVVAALEEDGWDRQSSPTIAGDVVSLSDGRWDVLVREGYVFEPEAGDPTEVELSFS